MKVINKTYSMMNISTKILRIYKNYQIKIIKNKSNICKVKKMNKY